ncbi:MAG: TolC family protein [Saprospiraceae bacterium]|nr:TolC family protein [Saprospiraceae bacterium]HMZ39946.1 TolC family protein [Saprospiraceae bacterium]HNA64504.1 TolC family protein [Saprospiraceae bacterium]HNB31582.1 TolC family protein [Saprospiraceae bacterium]HNC35503.1 TolC family protein [Saprospiraceae bacterium]
MRYFVVLITILPLFLPAQAFDSLIHQAWKNNPAVQAHNFQLEAATAGISEAKALYGPTANFGIQYSLARGGRSINLPIGDLLNPVYATLNQLTQSQSFPQIANTKEQFLPDNFYDAKVRIMQPVYYPDLALNKMVQKNQAEIKKLEIRAFRRLLARDIMQAAIQYNSAQYAIGIYASTDTLLQEAKRVNNSMIRNGMTLPSAQNRIEDQITSVHAQQTELSAQQLNALDYLSVLTGKTVNASEVRNISTTALPPLPPKPSAQREEIQQLERAIEMRKLSVQKENQFYIPRIGAQLDLGSQAFNFGFSPYALLGINMDLNLYDNKKHQWRKSAAQAQVNSLESEKTYAMQQMNMLQMTSIRNLESAIEQAKAFEQRITTSEKTYREVFSRYKQGMSNYIELLDAQEQWTQAQLRTNMAIQNAWLKWSEYIYNAAIYPVE